MAEKLRSARRQSKKAAGLKRAVREAVDRLHALREAASKLTNRLEEIEPDSRGRRRDPGGSKSTNPGAG